MSQQKNQKLQDLISLCKRRGFVFPSSEIYGGLAAIYDYGHYGLLLKNNIQNVWLKAMIQMRADVVGLDSAIFVHPKTWKASGHIDNFDDPQIDCRVCHARFRADELLDTPTQSSAEIPISALNEELNVLRAKRGYLACPACGSRDLTEAKRFSLMVKSNLGSPTESLSDDHIVYLRPETCGGIYLQYKNILQSLRCKVPFGVAQIGKAFRNEIVARQFIFRTREFEQMELQYFVHPKNTDEKYAMWKELRWQWYLQLGLSENQLRWHKHEKLAHYATQAYDIEYNFHSLGGFKEVEGIHARGNWDLTQHALNSGTDLTYFDEGIGEHYVPHIIETSAGLNRVMLMFLDNAYQVEFTGNDQRTVLKLHRTLAPIKLAILPLVKNNSEIINAGINLFDHLKSIYMCEYDVSGSVGKRYRRQDEIGTPLCITVDHDSLHDGCITVRDRDTMKQERININSLDQYLLKYFNKGGYV